MATHKVQKVLKVGDLVYLASTGEPVEVLKITGCGFETAHQLYHYDDHGKLYFLTKHGYNSQLVSHISYVNLADVLNIISVYGPNLTELIKKLEDSCPKANVVPAKYGYWVDIMLSGAVQSKCSSCGNFNDIEGPEALRHKAFCPNCGAIMSAHK